ncbi:hypothetical protein RIF29_39114 [Crotalaria pallida]|uniref:Uncharacterized protein n=1 Tax=Crotalaria pallida TaxID=3830 RepID=A0AAN9E0I2_CROPI
MHPSIIGLKLSMERRALTFVQTNNPRSHWVRSIRKPNLVLSLSLPETKTLDLPPSSPVARFGVSAVFFAVRFETR